MGDCRFCRKPAGWFRSQHKTCEEKYNAGHARISELAQVAILQPGDLSAAAKNAEGLAASHFLAKDDLPKLWLKAWETAVQNAFEDGVLSTDEEAALLRAANHFGWEQKDLDGNGAFTKVVQGGALRELLEGKLPARFTFNGRIPFNLQKGEQLIWAFPDVKYFEVRTRRSFVGGSQGVNLRIARGVYYRVGAFKGQPVETHEALHADTGAVAVTDRHLYFVGQLKSFRVRYEKVVAFTPYSDGIGIQRDAATAKPQALVTGDGWFIYNLVTNIAALNSGNESTGRRSSSAKAGASASDDDGSAFPLAIVGESNYQPALEAICGDRDEDGVDQVVDALLVLEDTNPHDDHAVRVDIESQTVGYLSRPDARRFRETHGAAASGSGFACKARIKGGWDRGEGDRGAFGVWLDVAL